MLLPWQPVLCMHMQGHPSFHYQRCQVWPSYTNIWTCFSVDVAHCAVYLPEYQLIKHTASALWHKGNFMTNYVDLIRMCMIIFILPYTKPQMHIHMREAFCKNKEYLVSLMTFCIARSVVPWLSKAIKILHLKGIWAHMNISATPLFTMCHWFS